MDHASNSPQEEYELRLSPEEEMEDNKLFRIDISRDLRDLCRQALVDLEKVLGKLLDQFSRKLDGVNGALEYSRKMLLLLIEPEMPREYNGRAWHREEDGN